MLEPAGQPSASFEEAFARHLQLPQATSNPAAFAAATEVLVAVITAAHPQLLLQLLQGSAPAQVADKVCMLSPYLSNLRIHDFVVCPDFIESLSLSAFSSLGNCMLL